MIAKRFMNLIRRSKVGATPLHASCRFVALGELQETCKDDPNRRVPAHSRFPLRPKGRSEAGGGLNALSHCTEEKAGACGKREWGGCRFSRPPPPLLEKEDYAD